MSSKISPLSLVSIYSLYQRKEKLLIELIGNMKLKEVNENATFESTTARIKKEILLKSVKFEPLVIAGHSEVERDSRGSFDNPFPHRRRVLMVEVNFPFTGSAELFSYAPDNMSFSLSGSGVWQPDYGNEISIEVEVPSLDRALVETRAASMMETTFSIINQINPQAKQWSEQMELRIDELLVAKRKEILNFYK